MAELHVVKEVRVVTEGGDEWVLRDVSSSNNRDSESYGGDYSETEDEAVVELETPDGATYDLDAEAVALLAQAFGELGY